MKRFVIIVLLLLSTAAIGFTQILDKTVATVNLHQPEIITSRQLDQRVEQLKLMMQPVTNKKDILNDMVAEVLIKQAAKYEGINVSDAEVLMAIKQQMGPQGASISDQQVKNLITQQTGLTWSVYAKQAKDQLSINNYLQLKKKDDFEKIKPPSEKEIEDIYNENSHLFINPEMVRFSQIYRDTRNLSPTEKRKARDLIFDVYRDLQNGVSSFEEMVMKYSDDTQSRYHGGDVGYLQRNDVNSQNLLGKSFFDSVFALKQGEISEVLESNIGYHIVIVTEKLPKRFLELDDPVTPATKETVRERIISLKMIEQQQIILQRAVEEIVSELKKDAEIVIYENNIQ